MGLSIFLDFCTSKPKSLGSRENIPSIRPPWIARSMDIMFMAFDVLKALRAVFGGSIAVVRKRLQPNGIQVENR